MSKTFLTGMGDYGLNETSVITSRVRTSVAFKQLVINNMIPDEISRS